MPESTKVVPKAQLSAATHKSCVSPFPIVGIGASAGDLEALEQFLNHIPPNAELQTVNLELQSKENDLMAISSEAR